MMFVFISFNDRFVWFEMCNASVVYSNPSVKLVVRTFLWTYLRIKVRQKRSNKAVVVQQISNCTFMTV